MRGNWKNVVNLALSHKVTTRSIVRSVPSGALNGKDRRNLHFYLQGTKNHTAAYGAGRGAHSVWAGGKGWGGQTKEGLGVGVCMFTSALPFT